MSNDDISAARTYHTTTNHTRERVSRDVYVLDPANHPRPYKIYSSLAPIHLSKDISAHPTTALAAIASPGIAPTGEQCPNREALARFCLLSNGVLQILKRSDRE